jgi:hypothetical protein
MNIMRALALALIATFGSAVWAQPGGDRPQFTPTLGSSWGPSWVGGQPAGGNHRPANFEAAMTRAKQYDDESQIGLGVRFWCDGEVVTGHQYQLLCQLRVHTKKGEAGPLLGTAAQPGGTTFLVTSGTADGRWNGLEGSIDITRKDLSGMTNLVKGKMNTLRIEPQLLDTTTGKYVTAMKSDAIIIMVNVDEGGRVDGVWSLSRWIVQNGQYSADKVLDVLGDLDAYDAEGNGIAEALGNVLNMKDIPAATRLRYVRGISKTWVHQKHPMLWEAISTMSNSDDKELSAAAKELLK